MAPPAGTLPDVARTGACAVPAASGCCAVATSNSKTSTPPLEDDVEVELPWLLELAAPEEVDAAADDDKDPMEEDDAGNDVEPNDVEPNDDDDDDDDDEESSDDASEVAEEEDADATSDDDDAAALLESKDAALLEDDGSRLLEDSPAELDGVAELLNPPLLELPATAVRLTQIPRASQVFSGRQSRSRVHVGSPGQAHSNGSAATSNVTSRACFAMYGCIRPSRCRKGGHETARAGAASRPSSGCTAPAAGMIVAGSCGF